MIAWGGDPAQPDDSVIFLDELRHFPSFSKITVNFIYQRAHSPGKLLIPPSFPVLCKAVNSLITGSLLLKL